MKKILIDTDGEFDDFMALVLALESKELNVEAITTLSGIRSLRDSTGEPELSRVLPGNGQVSGQVKR